MHPLDNIEKHMGKPYALIRHVRFDKGEAMRMVSLLYSYSTKGSLVKYLILLRMDYIVEMCI